MEWNSVKHEGRRMMPQRQQEYHSCLPVLCLLVALPSCTTHGMTSGQSGSAGTEDAGPPRQVDPGSITILTSVQANPNTHLAPPPAAAGILESAIAAVNSRLNPDAAYVLTEDDLKVLQEQGCLSQDEPLLQPFLLSRNKK
jgi:hypothetical protein